ncbi:MAG: hypothetical protein LAO31_01875 [Acidobacteriia bacterium]|nr:hypothetical protein [Terriglobia bacterium]
MQCPLCGKRKARRSCPAKSAQICGVCCATKREIEIDCPLSCSYLREGYQYAMEKNPLEQRARSMTIDRTFDRGFLLENERFLMELSKGIRECYMSAPQLHDSDIVGAFAALEKTFRTLDTGLYYDTRPEGGLEQILYLKLKESIDLKIQTPDIQGRRLKVSAVIDCLVFMQQFVQMKGSGRPLSRGYLTHLEEVFSHAPQESPSEEPRILLT